MSAKASNQPGRRTPLSLTGGITKGQSNNAKTAGGNSTNGHTNNNKNQQQKKTEQQQQQSNAQKQQQQQAEAKENPAKIQNKSQGSESKIPKLQTNQNSDSTNNKSDNKKVTVDKQQNGVVAAASNKANNTNQQPQGSNKDKKESTNATEAKTNEKDNNVEEKTTKEEKVAQSQIKSVEKDERKSSKEDKKEQQDLKKDENKTTDEKKENDSKKTEKNEMAKPEILGKDEKKPKESQKQTVEKMDVAEEEEEQQQKQDDDDQQTKKNSGEKSAAPSTPKSAKAENTKAPTPNKTPNKTSVEKTPTKSTNEEAANKNTSVNTSAKSTPTKREVTTAIDDVEMEPLTVADQSPLKAMPSENIAAGGALAFPSATSTPGKIVLSKRNVPAAKTDVQLAMQSSSSPDRPRAFSQISGRRGIRPITDYTPSKFQSNSQFRESYRRINTELDCTNTSLNVTVGSEVANNSSFSFFGRGRKRERTPPHHHSQSAIGELQTDVDMSPPKRARMDFFSVVSSPLTLLRNRFSKANLQSSTPVKLQKKLEENDDEDIEEVQNVSGVSVHEDIEKPDNAQENAEEGGDTTLGVEATTADHHNTPTEGELEIDDNGTKELPLKTEKLLSEDGDIKITVTDAVAKNKRCIVM